MIADERLAEALSIERWKGRAGAPVNVAERIDALALAGDADRAERFRTIVAKLDGAASENG